MGDCCGYRQIPGGQDVRLHADFVYSILGSARLPGIQVSRTFRCDWILLPDLQLYSLAAGVCHCGRVRVSSGEEDQGEEPGVRVLLLAGGDSSEREVSLTSGASVCKALRELGHHVAPLDPASGQYLEEHEGKLMATSEGSAEATAIGSDIAYRGLIQAWTSDALVETDVVFIALHGGSGENGTIQCLLDLAGVPYTGSGMTASAAAMDKAMAKRLMEAVQVPTPRWGLCDIRVDEDVSEIAAEINHQFKTPLIIKPDDGGSTIGLTKVQTAEGIGPALRMAAEHGRKVLVEEYIAGRELTVAVFDGKAYPIVEIKPVNELYDYEAKYTKGKSEYVAPAEVDEKLGTEMQEAALRVYDAVGAAGLARVDFILGDAGDYYCLEINTLPGMTALSLAPMAMQVEGIDFPHMLQMMLESALRQKT
ncbi:D-alanine--D-alanine ligase [candidate division GN15 bacterium]|nr:D-alanine--D-alanine ligase [candidate division GN15 bacterium]